MGGKTTMEKLKSAPENRTQGSRVIAAAAGAPVPSAPEAARLVFPIPTAQLPIFTPWARAAQDSEAVSALTSQTDALGPAGPLRDETKAQITARASREFL